MPLSTYQKNVFINCPFDPAFRTLLEAIVFTVHDCGFVARSALEADDSSQVRIAKIYRIISDCGFGVHDLSRTELDPTHSLPRFNMPLELGIFLGAKRFGDDTQRCADERRAVDHLALVAGIGHRHRSALAGRGAPSRRTGGFYAVAATATETCGWRESM